MRGMGVGGWEEGSWGLEICLLRFNPVQAVYYHLLARVYLVPSKNTKIVEIAVLQVGFNPQAAAAEIRRAHSGASLTLSLTSDWTYDKLTEASLCQHSTAPPPDLLLVDARRLMTTSILPQSFVDLSQSPFPFLSFRPRSTVSRIRLLLY